MDTGPAAIGRYQVRARLGQGGMGVLYLALDPAIDRLIALKLLRGVDDELRERFMREARLAARLQHPNIVTIYDVGSHEGQPFIAMEYIAGETLAELIHRRAPLTTLRKLELALDACQGLAYAHKNGVVHRDIKPANLMVGRDAGVLKVLDFGIARGAESTLTQIGMLMGTPNYMAPEQVEGKPTDQRADIFSLGLVLYELLAYRPAFKADTPHAVLHQVLHASPTPLHEVDATLDRALGPIVDKAIAKDPSARYPDLDRLRVDLLRVVQRLKAEPDAATRVIQAAPPQARIAPGADAPEIASWMTKARTLVDAGSLTEAGQAVLAALQIDRHHSAAQAMRIEIDRAIEERAREHERARSVSRALAQADASLQAGALDAALRATGEALGYDPSHADALAARARVLTLVDREASRAIADARAQMAAGRQDQALQRLQDFAPWHEAVDTALVELRRQIGQKTLRRRADDERRTTRETGGVPEQIGEQLDAQVGRRSDGQVGGQVGERIDRRVDARLDGPAVTEARTTQPTAVLTPPARARRPRVYLAAGVAALVVGGLVAGRQWLGSGQPPDPSTPNNAALARPTGDPGAGTPGGSATPGTGASGAVPAGTGAAGTDTAAGGQAATGKPAGDPAAANRPVTGTSATPPPAGSPPSAPGTSTGPATPSAADRAVGAGPAANAGNTTPATDARIDAAVNDVRRLLEQRQRPKALDALRRHLATFSEAPKLRTLRDEVVSSAQRDADRARTDATQAQAPVRAAAEYQRAETQFRDSAQLRARGRLEAAISGYWRAQDEFDAARLAATRAATTAPAAAAITEPPKNETAKSETGKGETGKGEAGRNETAKPAVPAPAPTVTAPTPGTPAGASPAGTPQTDAPPPPAPADNRAAIQQTLNRYAAAFATLKTSQVAAVWPTMTTRQVNDLDRAFRDTARYDVTLSNCRISEAGTRATAMCTVVRAIQNKGRPLQSRSSMPTFQLEKRGSDWVIIDVTIKE